jgi:hypothetical protein
MIFEIGIPKVELIVPENVINSLINKNDDISCELIIDANPDDLFFNLVFYYKYEVVGSSVKKFNKFAF